MNSSKGRIITIDSEDDEFSTPQPQSQPQLEPHPNSSPTSGDTAGGGAVGEAVSNPVRGQGAFGPSLPNVGEPGAGSLLPLPGSQRLDSGPGQPASTRSRKIGKETNTDNTPKSSKTSSKTLTRKSIRPALSIVFDNTPAINESPVTSQGFPGGDLPAVLPSGHATPTSPSEVRTRSSRRTNKK